MQTMEKTEAPEALLTVREAARLARVSVAHVYRLVERGEVPAVRVGEGHGPIRLERKAFLAWLYGDPEGSE